MADYTGEVIANSNADFPFMAVVSDAEGTVVGEFPVRTQADGEAKIIEALKDLADPEHQVQPAAL